MKPKKVRDVFSAVDGLRISSWLSLPSIENSLVFIPFSTPGIRMSLLTDCPLSMVY